MERLILILLLFTATLNAQTGEFDKMNGEDVECKVEIIRDSILHVVHNGFGWLEKIDSTFNRGHSLAVYLPNEKWVLYYDRLEAGTYNRQRFVSAWVYQPIGDPIHYHE